LSCSGSGSIVRARHSAHQSLGLLLGICFESDRKISRQDFLHGLLLSTELHGSAVISDSHDISLGALLVGLGDELGAGEDS